MNSRKIRTRRSILLLITASLIPLMAAQAQVGKFSSFSKVNTSQITILGRGLQDKETSDSIAVACAGPVGDLEKHDCTLIRHVYFHAASGTADFFGDTYESTVDASGTEKSQQKLDDLSSAFKKFKRHENKQKNLGRMVLVTMGGGALIASLPMLIGVSVPLATTALILNWGVSVPVIYQYGRGSKILGDHATATDVLLNQNGWNWSVSPRLVKPSSFKMYFNFVEHCPTPDDPSSLNADR